MIDVHFPEFGEQTVMAGKVIFCTFVKATKTKTIYVLTLINWKNYDTNLKLQWDWLSMI